MLVIVVAALVVSIAAAHVRPTGHAHSSGGELRTPPRITLSLPSQSVPPDHKLKPNAATGVLAALLFAAGVAVIAGILLFVLRALYNLLRSLRAALRRRRRKTQVVATGMAPADLARQMSDAVDDALEELNADRPVSDSIIRCWQRLQTAAADAGVRPELSDTPDEAIRRIFFATEVSGTPLRTLAELYREARFSQHTMGPQNADTARAALNAIFVDLRTDAPEPDDVRA
jgi:hypothetical protein